MAYPPVDIGRVTQCAQYIGDKWAPVSGGTFPSVMILVGPDRPVLVSVIDDQYCIGASTQLACEALSDPAQHDRVLEQINEINASLLTGKLAAHKNADGEFSKVLQFGITWNYPRTEGLSDEQLSGLVETLVGKVCSNASYITETYPELIK